MISLFNRFIRSEQIINEHLQKDFPILLLISTQIRYLHVFTFLIMLCVGEQMYTTHAYVAFTHGTNLMILSVVNVFIMLFYNTPTTEVLMQSLKAIGYATGGSYMAHNALSLYFIPPNSISNAYHIYSPTGRGYGAYSCSQLLAVDALKGAQGPNFDPNSIVDVNQMLDNKLIAKQFERTANLPPLSAFFKGNSSK